MPDYTQDGRALRFDTVLGKDVLLLDGFHGVEGVSQPYSFLLDVLSTNADIAAADLLRTKAAITLQLPDGGERTIHGLIRRFTQLGRHDDLVHYQAELVPWLWFLSLSRESRVYQKLSVLDIVEQVFSNLGYSDFDIRCIGSYAPREYCVQYRETHFNFVSRLLEEEGIFYFFEHSPDGHMLVLADSNSSVAECVGAANVRFTEDPATEEDVVRMIRDEHAVHAGTMTLNDYDYLDPALSLESSLSGVGAEEVYDYPGKYTKPAEGERYARLLLEAEETRQEMLNGEGTCRGFRSGGFFNLEAHYRSSLNAKYVLTRVQHFAQGGGFRAEDAGTPMNYHNDFLCIPYDMPYRPLRRTPRPTIHGTQSALVVGVKGEEVYTDKHGRIKVQFYWDRQGKKDENSSCWIRVASPWGGKAWGAVSTPRLGNEVLVAFEEGDPDRPIVVGSLYNADQTPPFALPGIQMGMKSRSSKGGGGYNEITMTDTKGSELINIHGQYDMTTTVEHDQTDTVNNNRSTTIAVDDTESVGSNQKIDVGADQTTTVKGNQKTSVTGNRDISVDGNQSVAVAGNEKIDVSGDRTTSITGKDTVSVGADQTIDVGANQKISISANGELTIGANHKIDAGAQIKVNAGAKIEITAGAMISLEAGGSKIEIGPAGVTIQTGAIVNVQGATIKLN